MGLVLVFMYMRIAHVIVLIVVWISSGELDSWRGFLGGWGPDRGHVIPMAAFRCRSCEVKGIFL